MPLCAKVPGTRTSASVDEGKNQVSLDLWTVQVRINEAAFQESTHRCDKDPGHLFHRDPEAPARGFGASPQPRGERSVALSEDGGHSRPDFLVAESDPAERAGELQLRFEV